ncbi:hypothetical protein POTOM_032516 [Populus tomentosa]|uniref:Protein kinase domain-containing protein n=1 Tax=Populus tomentosa TaxID=118781 RepID=A0A8X7Z430_POPTO|nr:hypothetical protein POTOM_032516 [Populus tomentosa]
MVFLLRMIHKSYSFARAMGCCSCFGFLRKPKRRPVPISSGVINYHHHNYNNHLSQELLLDGEIDDDGGEDEGSFNGDITGTSYCDYAELPNRAKRSEENLRLRELNGLVCRKSPVKETHLLVRSEDEDGNKMINEYVRQYKIGAGSYGKVVLYQSSIDGKLCAIKAFHKSHLLKLRVAPSETAMTDVLREVSASTYSLVLWSRVLSPFAIPTSEPLGKCSCFILTKLLFLSSFVGGVASPYLSDPYCIYSDVVIVMSTIACISFAMNSCGSHVLDKAVDGISKKFGFVPGRSDYGGYLTSLEFNGEKQKEKKPPHGRVILDGLSIPMLIYDALVLIMKMLDHPNIVNLIEVIDDPNTDHFYMVLEYVDGKWVWEGSGPPGGIGEDTARKYLRDIVSGLMYLHAHNIVHGDIKPDNLLVTRSGTVKIGDFSVSQVVEDDNDELRRSPGTPVFTAPECCLGLTYHGKAADTWAVGVTLYCMIVNNPLVLPDELNSQLKDLLEGLLCKDPAQRMTLDAVANHTWVIGDDGPIPQFLCWCKRSSRESSDGNDDGIRNHTESNGSEFGKIV